MSDVDSRYGFNPRHPWHVQIRRDGHWVTVETFRETTDLIRFVAALPDPGSINVFHAPTVMDGNGVSFLLYSKMRGLMPYGGCVHCGEECGYADSPNCNHATDCALCGAETAGNESFTFDKFFSKYGRE